MEALLLYLRHLLSFYIANLSELLLYPFHKIIRPPIFVPFVETILSIYFTFSCNLVQCTVDIDDQTTMNFWVPTHRRFNKPNLVMIHGFGANGKWQFVYQVGELAKSFNLYIPDLIFFGKSDTKSPNRTETFQAQCIFTGLKQLGVDTCSVYSISYGGYVGYRVAEIHPEMVDKLVIVSSGVGCTEDLKREQLNKVGCDLLLPREPEGVRKLVEASCTKETSSSGHRTLFFGNLLILRTYSSITQGAMILYVVKCQAMCNRNRKGKEELVQHLANKSENNFRALSQYCLYIWGDKDKIFPLSFAHHLQRNIGPDIKLEIIPDTGHAVNIDSPYALNALIKRLILCADR